MNEKRYVFMTKAQENVYWGKETLPLEWIEIGEDVRDAQVYQAFPGKYATHPRNPDIVYILPFKAKDGNRSEDERERKGTKGFGEPD